MNEFPDLNAYADGELTAAERAQVEAKLAESPELREELAAIEAIKAQLKAECGPILDQIAWQSCRKRLDELDRVRPIEQIVGRFSWLATAAVAATLVGAHFFYNKQGASLNPAINQAGLSALRTNDHQENIPELLAKEGIILPPRAAYGTLHPTNFARFQTAEGLPGVRIWMSDDRGSMMLDAVRGINVIEGEEISGTIYTRVKVNSLRGVAWTKNGVGYVLVGDRAESDLQRAAERIHR